VLDLCRGTRQPFSAQEIKMSKPLENKLALVTGSSRGIGAAWVKSELNFYSLVPPQFFLATFQFDNYLTVAR
jgi:hypothetical protein